MPVLWFVATINMIYFSYEAASHFLDNQNISTVSQHYYYEEILTYIFLCGFAPLLAVGFYQYVKNSQYDNFHSSGEIFMAIFVLGIFFTCSISFI